MYDPSYICKCKCRKVCPHGEQVPESRRHCERLYKVASSSVLTMCFLSGWTGWHGGKIYILEDAAAGLGQNSQTRLPREEAAEGETSQILPARCPSPSCGFQPFEGPDVFRISSWGSRFLSLPHSTEEVVISSPCGS